MISAWMDIESAQGRSGTGVDVRPMVPLSDQVVLSGSFNKS